MYQWRKSSSIGWFSAFVAGLLGSIVLHLFAPQHAEGATMHGLRGSRLELVDNRGKVRALLYCGREGEPHFRMLSSEDKVMIDIGLNGASTPYLTLNGSDGTPRVDVKIGYDDKPVMWMGDNRSPSKLVLGAIQTDSPDPNLDMWALESSIDQLHIAGRSPGSMQSWAVTKNQLEEQWLLWTVPLRTSVLALVR